MRATPCRRAGASCSRQKNEADGVLIRLSDDGEGMTEAVMARALEPFYTTKGVGKGSGMGLPQAYGLRSSTAAR